MSMSLDFPVDNPPTRYHPLTTQLPIKVATDAVSAALAYRAQAPVLDGLMKELGLDGSSLDSLVKGPEAAEPAPRPAEVLDDIAEQVEEAEAKAPAKPEATKGEDAPAA